MKISTLLTLFPLLMPLSVLVGTVLYADSHHPPSNNDASVSVIYLDAPEQLQAQTFGEMSSNPDEAQRQVKAVLQSPQWQAHERELATVYRAVVRVWELGIVLKRQPQDYQGPFKCSFYYQMNENMESELQWMGKAARHWRVRGQFTQCNPATGDPADCYDVDFIAQCCGKDEALSFIMERLDVSQEKIWAFGDSCNDFAMFERAGQGYLVGNADPVAKQQKGEHLALPYCHGILSVLETI